MLPSTTRIFAITAALAAAIAVAEPVSEICRPSLNGDSRYDCMMRLEVDNSNNSPSSSGRTPLLEALFPVPPLQSWTTCSDAADALPLSDETLQPTKVLKDLKWEYVWQAGKTAMKVFYPKGSMNPGNNPKGGVSFYSSGPSWVDLRTAKEATFAYSVYFEEGFEFNLGGKIPGLYGGESDDGSVSCSGGARNDACFSCRLMWREEGKGELYTYLPPSFPANDKVCSIPPYSECNPAYGASVGRGSWYFTPGRWVTVAERVRLNDAGPGEDGGAQNAEIEVFADGVSVVSVSGLVLRRSNQGLFRGIMVQSFFGGSHPGWEAPKDSTVYFADFSVAITQYF